MCNIHIGKGECTFCVFQRCLLIHSCTIGSYDFTLAAAFASRGTPTFHSALLTATFASKSILSCHFALLAAAFASESILSCHFALLAAAFASESILSCHFALLMAAFTSENIFSCYIILPAADVASPQYFSASAFAVSPHYASPLAQGRLLPAFGFSLLANGPLWQPSPCRFLHPAVSAALPQRSLSAVFSHVVAETLTKSPVPRTVPSDLHIQRTCFSQ